MDPVKFQSLEALTQSIKAHYLFKLTQLFLSVSLCSFLFSPSSLLAFLHYFNFYFSTFPFQLFTHTIDKNCMFLLCNGLLVFVGITRSFSGSSGNDDRDDDDEASKYVHDGSKLKFSYVEANEVILEKEAEERSREFDEENNSAGEAMEIKYSADVEEHIEEGIVEDEEQEKGSFHSDLKEEADEETEILSSEADDFLVEENLEEEEYEEEEEEEEEEGGGGGNWVLSTEEMNKKFDDFIRRMREDLRIEAQQQLIMV